MVAKPFILLSSDVLARSITNPSEGDSASRARYLMSRVEDKYNKPVMEANAMINRTAIAIAILVLLIRHRAKFLIFR